MDTISMIIKDLGRTVKSDKENIEILVKNNFIPHELGEFLNLANGLRNLLIHRYKGIEEDKVLGKLNELKENLTLWIEKLEEILNEIKNASSN